jgi:hypothetical protein
MSEKINAKKSYESIAGNTTSEINEMDIRKTFSQREVGFNHPDNSSFIRLTDAGDIEIFATPGVGIIINGTTKTISFFADNIKFHSKEDGLKWNSMEFNHSATTFSEPALVEANHKSYNPAFMNMDHYIKNLDLLDKEESQQTVTINGDYAYDKMFSNNEVPIADIGESSTSVNDFSKQDIVTLDSFWNSNLSYNEKAMTVEKYYITIRSLMSSGRSLNQALAVFKESIGNDNV